MEHALHIIITSVLNIIAINVLVQEKLRSENGRLMRVVDDLERLVRVVNCS